MLKPCAVLTTVGVLLAAAAASQGSPQKKLDPRTAEDNLRKAQAAAAASDSALKWLARAAWVGVVLRGTTEWRTADRFFSEATKAAGDLKKGTDKLAELAATKAARSRIEKEAATLLKTVMLVRLDKQAEELERLGAKVRGLPVGLVSDRVDDKFKVSADLVVKAPREAQTRFKAFLAAMKTSADFLDDSQKALNQVAANAKAAAQVVRRLQVGIEKVAPAAGIHNRALTALYLELDKLGRGYSGLASDCATKAKEASHAAAVERRRYDNLRTTIRTLFRFDS
jgi:hypothetical protein